MLFLELGKITLFPYDFEPSDWMYCDGRLVPIADNEVLFTLLGTNFGGDGDNTFAVPDLTKINPPNCNYCISIKGTLNDNYHEGIVGATMLSITAPMTSNVKECTGQLLMKEQAPLLMIYMGSRFGGDGVKNFKLPDMRGQSPDGLRYAMAVQGNDPDFPREPYVGELCLLPYEVESGALLLCNGSRVSRQTYGALYSVLETRFGGDPEHFALPDLRDVAPPKYSYYISTRGVFPARG